LTHSNGNNTGGPAFPVEQHDKDGMTLRDYFAAKAMQALVQKYSHASDVSRHAYKLADAMMEARNV